MLLTTTSFTFKNVLYDNSAIRMERGDLKEELLSYHGLVDSVFCDLSRYFDFGPCLVQSFNI